MNFFEASSDIRVFSLSDWLDCACGKAADPFVALPMIQRGSVWKPHQIIDLWDSLLQGMPTGSMMVSELKEGACIRRIGASQSERIPAGGGLGLIDGQQRTLAMLIAWPSASNIDRRVWVDFSDEAAPGHLLRLRVTTENQPFGFERSDPSRKLSLDDRRKARAALCQLRGQSTVPTLDNAWPYSSEMKLTIDLRYLIRLWRNKSSSYDWREKVREAMESLEGVRFHRNHDAGEWRKEIIWRSLEDSQRVEACERVEKLEAALSRLDRLKIPFIRVDERFFKVQASDTSDPPLATLFNRIGAGGTALSNEDYIYSVIKHIRPETHDFVESLQRSKTVASLLTATDLVMSAVRLGAAEWTPPDTRERLPDMENPEKRDLHRLLQHGDFIGQKFIPLIDGSGGECQVSHYFGSIQRTIQYRALGDTGLPKHAFPLLGRPLVQVLLRLAQVGYIGDATDELRRFDVLRLIMFWLVAVTDAHKASRLAYEVIKDGSGTKSALGRAIHDRLIQDFAAVQLVPLNNPELLAIAFSPSNISPLRAESRFKIQGKEVSKVGEFYRGHWWRPFPTYHHPLLLWLQRDMVAREMDKIDPMAGREEETPYDYDHILPQDHWGYWTGVTSKDRLLDFAESPLKVLGNAIGNIRVWDAILNRGDGNISPVGKLKLNSPKEEVQRLKLLKDSCIEEDQIDSWKAASGSGNGRSWSESRAIAFQTAVEKRTFQLYERFFNELGFTAWQEPLISEPVLGDS